MKDGSLNGAGVGLFDIAAKKLLRIFPGNQYGMDALAFSPDGKTLATGSNEGFVRLWDIETGEAYRTWQPSERGAIESVAYSPDGKILATGNTEGNIMLWDAESAKLLRTMSEEPLVRHLVFSPDGATLVSGGYMEKGEEVIGSQGHAWNTADGAFKQRFNEADRMLTGIAFSPDGRLLATTSLQNESRSDDGEIKLWDTQSGALKTIRDVAGADSVVFSPQATRDNIIFATLAGTGKVKLWQVKLPPTP
jgi:WD40 repeat protein